MKKLIVTGLAAITLFLVSLNAQAQTVVKETTFNPDGKAKITNLSEVQIDKDNNQMVLFYLTKSTGKKIKAEILYFDLDFNFLRAESVEEDLEKMREKYKLTWGWSACNESKEPLLTIEPNLTGQIVFKKGFIDRYYNWNTGLCDDRFKVEEKVKPKGDDGEKLKLVNYWTNNDLMTYIRSVSAVAYSYRSAQRQAATMSALYGRQRDLMSATEGDVVFLGSIYDKKDKENFGKHFVFQKFSVQKLEKIKETKLDFPVMTLPIYFKILESGNIGYLFFRIDKKYEFIEVNYEGDIQRRYIFEAPTDQIWAIDDMTVFENEIYIHGVQPKTTMNQGFVYATLGNAYGFVRGLYAYSLKPTNYQIMKVGENSIEWVSRVPLKDFKSSFVAIDGEKAGKPFTGGSVSIGQLHVAKNGNVIVTGQKRNNKNEMQEVVAFHFDQSGKMVANYSSRLRDKNDYNKFTPTKHALMDAPDGNGVYWTVFEVAGAKKYGESARVLYYPRIARISKDGRKVSEFLEVGGGKFFLDDKFPVNYLDDGTFIFIGSNRKGKDMWFAKVKF